MRVQAIETTYRGYRFRSRLEARWAVFFDALGVQWQYEPQGFLVGGTPYLPDFYLPEHGTWVEVKGRIDQAKVLELAVAATDGFSGGNLPFYCPKVPAEYAEKPSNRDDWLNTEYGSSLGLLIVGEIPDPSRELIGHDLFVSHKGALREPHYFTTGPRLLEPINCVDAYIHCYDISVGPAYCTHHGYWDIGSSLCNQLAPFEYWKPHGARRSPPAVLAAYSKARKARFEHGQIP